MDWSDFSDGHPGRAIGELLPGLVLGVVTDGAGEVADDGLDAAAQAARTAGDSSANYKVHVDPDA